MYGEKIASRRYITQIAHIARFHMLDIGPWNHSRTADIGFAASDIHCAAAE
jgi:hypothetical protein